MEDETKTPHGPRDVGVPAQGIGEPKGYWEYLDEDFVGNIAKIAMRKGGGNTHKACSMNTMDRYRALLALGGI